MDKKRKKLVNTSGAVTKQPSTSLEVQDKFIELIRGGINITMACLSSGFNRNTYREWKLKVNKQARMTANQRDFMDRVREALLEFQQSQIEAINSSLDWKAHDTLLKRSEKSSSGLEFLDLNFSLLAPKEVGILCFLISKARGEKPDREDFVAETKSEADYLIETSI